MCCFSLNNIRICIRHAQETTFTFSGIFCSKNKKVLQIFIEEKKQSCGLCIINQSIMRNISEVDRVRRPS